MVDQASELRQLVLERAEGLKTPGENRAKFVTLFAGKGGVGTTSAAVNLANSFFREGYKTLLVDADLDHGDVATLCGLTPRMAVRDLLAGRNSLEKAILAAHGGVDVLCGIGTHDTSENESWMLPLPSDGPKRLFRNLTEMQSYDLIVVDAGNRVNRIALEAWNVADLVVAVTTADLPSLMDTYKAIKGFHGESDNKTVGTLVNMESDDETIAEVHQRIATASKRFLGLEVSFFGSLEMAANMIKAANSGTPIVLADPLSRIAEEVTEIGRTILGQLKVEKGPVPSCLFPMAKAS